MNLIHKAFILSNGSYARIIGSDCICLKETIYQYVVDLLFPGNNWQRIWVSKLYYDRWEMLLEVERYIRSSRADFEAVYLVKKARGKYGQEYKTPGVRSL